MLFAFEQLTVSTSVFRLTENSYTISNQFADCAIFTITGGDIKVRYDGDRNSSDGQVLDKDAAQPYILESREQIEGFIFSVASGSPIIDILYVMLE